ncbi:MAG: hypothetical protein ACK53L_06960 [Pirellulaceae bacterium]
MARLELQPINNLGKGWFQGRRSSAGNPATCSSAELGKRRPSASAGNRWLANVDSVQPGAMAKAGAVLGSVQERAIVEG